ncbi:FG-GAP-like repeat-containing protein [bacterium]|nr:FG-GAP-like repeat-containing protein [bacterium]
MKYLISLLLVVSLLLIETLAFSQDDNGNNFEMSWSVDFSVYKGDQGKGLYAFAPADIDQDGHKEFFVYDKILGLPSFDRLLCFEAVGDNDFRQVWSQEYTRWPDDEGHGLTVADLDNDGNEELIVSAEEKVFIYEWDGMSFESGGGLPQQPTATIDPLFDNSGNAWIRQIWVVNLDPDPIEEIFMGYFGESGLYSVIMSLPSQDFSVADWEFEFADDFTPWRCGGIAIADFDGDGKMDIWSSHFNDLAATRVYENDGVDNYAIKFTTLPGELVLDPPYDSTIANAIFHDFDGDGQGELVIMDSHGYMYIITKESSNNFTDFGSSAYQFVTRFPLPEPHAGFMRSGFLGDLDRDGKPDIYYNVNKLQAVLDLEYQGGPLLEESSWIKYQIYKGHKLVFGYIQPADDLDGDSKGEIVIAGNGDPVANLQIIENQDAVTHVSDRGSATPKQFTLYQNVPNPFNPVTSIRFDIPEPSDVLLQIHDLLGRSLRTLVSDMQAAGSHEVIWDGKDDLGRPVAGGQYYYTLRVGNYKETKKLMLVK